MEHKKYHLIQLIPVKLLIISFSNPITITVDPNINGQIGEMYTVIKDAYEHYIQFNPDLVDLEYPYNLYRVNTYKERDKIIKYLNALTLIL